MVYVAFWTAGGAVLITEIYLYQATGKNRNIPAITGAKEGTQMKERNSSKAIAFRGVAMTATAIGAVAVGAFAIGALAIGRLAIRRLLVERVKFKSLEIEELTVTRLRAGEVTVSESLKLP